jgi:aspartyl-tRNA(Asn)/glutamyl-tRNA(Gln) amidotransferase subunit C
MFDIKSYESLAKLSLNESERTVISKYSELLTKSFDELEEISVEKVKPLVTVLNVNNILREDISTKFMTREELLSNAPEQSDGYFQVPRTID